MNRLLLNPNQLRAFDVPVCDDLIDPNRNLGITLLEAFVPIKIRGSICGFVSRCSINEELYLYQRFQFSDESTWDLSPKIFIYL